MTRGADGAGLELDFIRYRADRFRYQLRVLQKRCPAPALLRWQQPASTLVLIYSKKPHFSR
jgi:hypothetical protein